ncbi:MAG: 2-C-methyl-D-erythritol 4-phosphate cytidylyltransferase, partial [Treponema berlinense]|nr:2-C-methyl-D-erythritol 4-phosphate cytidylyltransferase [Treponema berlinense]
MMTKTNRSNEELALIVVAAGSSSRMGGIKKEYLPLESGTVLSTAVKAFLRTLPFSVVAVTFPNQENPELLKSAEEKCKNALFEDKEFNKIANNTEFIFVPGGASRQSSVFNALLKIKANFPNSNPVVFIHDGARPFVSKKIINSTFAAVQKYGASAPGIQPTDTQNEIDKNGFIKRHLVRSQLTAVQTPQVFMLNELVEAHKKAKKTKKEYTDDTEIWDLFVPEGKVKIVDGDIKNKKITYREDFFTEPEI